MKSSVVAPQNTFLDSILRRSNELDLTFVIGNAALEHYPIIYSSERFSKATEYSKSEVLHRSCTCEFLWGTLTSKETQKLILGTIAAKTTLQTEVVLYKKNKQPCWFLYQISPIKNDDEKVILFLITFKDISHLKDPIAEPTVKKWSRLVEKSLAKQRSDLSKSSDNARSVFLQLAKKDTNKKQKLAQLISNTSMNSIQYSWEGQKVPRFTVFHYSLFKTIWDWVILILTLYTAVVAPFVVSFQYSSGELVIFNLLVDTVFIVDVILNFKTTYCGKDGEIVFDTKLICMNYVKSWFLVDFVAALPYGVLNLAYTNARWIEIINVIKVIRLIRLLRVARKLDHYLKFGAMTLVLWLFLFCLCCHWMACIWYVIAINYDKPTTTWSWVYILADITKEPYQYKNGKLVEGSGPSIASAYMSSLYYCMSSLTTCGFGNIAPNTTAEKIFGCITMLLGCLLYAFIFGQVTSIIQQLQKPSSDYHQRLDSIRRFIKLYTVPEEIGRRLVDYFMTTWASNKGLDVEQVLELFPRDLQADACLQIHKVVFETMPEFKTAPLPALRNISRFFFTVRSAPGAKVVQHGEVVESLYFVERGSLEIRKQDQIVGILGPGDVFGGNVNEAANKIEKAMYEIHTLTYSDLHVIKVKSLIQALQLFPDFFRKFKKELVHSFNLSRKMRVYGRNGKRHNVFQDEETSFIESKSDVESISNSHDQTMVEGQLSSDHLNRERAKMRASPTLVSGFTNDNKIDIFTELDILREDVKANIQEVNDKISTFDHKINLILGLLQKKNAYNPPGSELATVENNNSCESITSADSDRELNNNLKKAGAAFKQLASKNAEKGYDATKTFSTKESEETQVISKTRESKNGDSSKTDSDTNKLDLKSDKKTTSLAKKYSSLSKKESFHSNNGESGKASKKGIGREENSAKKESESSHNLMNTKTGGNRVSPEKQISARPAKSKSNKPAMKQPKKATTTDDLDELEKELEEIGMY